MQSWNQESRDTLTTTKKLLSNLSLNTRKDQYRTFLKVINPQSENKILDVGVTSNEKLKDANFFEKIYPYKKRLTAVTIDNPKGFMKRNPKIKVIQISSGTKLPFKNKSFDVVVSWATLEHVGDYKKQKDFINELNRVGKKVFLTTPDRGCFYEPHSGFFFLHWFPLNIFRFLCSLLKKEFWSFESNLNPLYIKDVKQMKIKSKMKIISYKIFGFLPSHILVYS